MPLQGVGGGTGARRALLYPRGAAVRCGFDSRGRPRVVHDRARARLARPGGLICQRSTSAWRLESWLQSGIS